jgi:hypothetical protein
MNSVLLCYNRKCERNIWLGLWASRTGSIQVLPFGADCIVSLQRGVFVNRNKPAWDLCKASLVAILSKFCGMFLILWQAGRKLRWSSALANQHSPQRIVTKLHQKLVLVFAFWAFWMPGRRLQRRDCLFLFNDEIGNWKINEWPCSPHLLIFLVIQCMVRTLSYKQYCTVEI